MTTHQFAAGFDSLRTGGRAGVPHPGALSPAVAPTTAAALTPVEPPAQPAPGVGDIESQVNLVLLELASNATYFRELAADPRMESSRVRWAGAAAAAYDRAIEVVCHRLGGVS